MADYTDSTGTQYTVASAQVRVGADVLPFAKFKMGGEDIDQTQVFRTGDRFPAAVVTGAAKADKFTGSIPLDSWTSYTAANPKFALKRVEIVVTLLEEDLGEKTLVYEGCKLASHKPSEFSGGDASEALVDCEWQPRRMKTNGQYSV